MKKYIHYFLNEEKEISSFAQKCLDNWIEKLPKDYELILWSIDELDKIDEDIAKKINSLKNYGVKKGFLETYALYKYGGLYVDQNLQLIEDITDLLENNKCFLGVDEKHNISTSVWYESKQKGYLATKVYKKYKENYEKGIYNDYYLDLQIMLKDCIIDFDPTSKDTQQLSHDITIYGYDYFYPYSYDGYTKNKTKNTKAINYVHYDYITLKGKLKNFTYNIFGETVSKKVFKFFRAEKDIIKFLLKPILNYRKNKKKNNKKHKKLLESAINRIDKYKDKYYVAFHNPEYTGVSNATIELFENCVPCGELLNKKEIHTVAQKLLENNIKEVIFSGFCIGWGDLARELHANNIIVKTYFHGSHSQYLDEYGWEMNNLIFDLEKEGIVKEMAFCKESIIDFYKEKAGNVAFLRNLVNIDYNIKPKKKKNDIIYVGVYAVQTTNWRKNVFSSLGGIALFNELTDKKIIVDIVPKSSIADSFMHILGIETDGIDKAIPREKLLNRMSNCNINLYVTYSECAPMLPLESFYVKVPCLTGNNHHYFQGTELEKYLVINNENSPKDISETIERCLKNEDKVMKLYDKFKEYNLKEGKRLVKEFLDIKGDQYEK